MPVWKQRYPGVENMNVAVMGCIVNGPGESKHADIGISLPGTGESPAAPVFIDGKKAHDPARRAHRRGVPGASSRTTSSAASAASARAPDLPAHLAARRAYADLLLADLAFLFEACEAKARHVPGAGRDLQVLAHGEH